MEAVTHTMQIRDTARSRGILLVLAAGVLWSTIGLGVRLMESAEAFQIVFYRATGQVPVILMMLTVRYRGQFLRAFRRVGITGVIGALLLAGSYTSGMYSLQKTTIANAVFALSAAPLMAGLLAWFILREPIRRTTWLAMGLALGGILIMTAGAQDAGQLPGNLAALGSALGLAGFTVALRRGKDIDMLPVIALSGGFAMVFGGFAAENLAVTAGDLGISLFLGLVAQAFGLALYAAGSRHLTAAELPLFAMAGTLLTPMWVWLFVGEPTDVRTLAGGAVVLGAVLIQGFFGARHKLLPRGYTF